MLIELALKKLNENIHSKYKPQHTNVTKIQWQISPEQSATMSITSNQYVNSV